MVGCWLHLLAEQEGTVALPGLSLLPGSFMVTAGGSADFSRSSVVELLC